MVRLGSTRQAAWLVIFCVYFLSQAQLVVASERSYKIRKAFMLENPCPATGEAKGKCPGWIMDHIVPLCARGRDEPWNLQWQTVEAAKAKDRIEVRECRRGN